MKNLCLIVLMIASLELMAQDKPTQPAAGAPAQAKGETLPAARSGFDWDRVTNAVAAARWDEVSRYFREKDGVRITRLAVGTEKDLQHQLLAREDVTPEAAAAAIAEAKLDAALLKASDAKLVRVVNNLLYFDVPLEKVAPLGKTLAAAGYETRLLIFRGPGSFNIPRTGPQ